MAQGGRHDVGAQGGLIRRAALGFLVAHTALIAFSTLAMVTILAGEFPVWMQGPYTQTVYEYAWRYSGQTCIVLGATAALCYASHALGLARAGALLGSAAAVTLGAELIGTNFGVPFGPYEYTAMLGYRVAGDVPYVIPLSWAYMLFCCVALASRAFRFDDSSASRWKLAAVSALWLVAWDVPLEVQMTNVAPVHWMWHLDQAPSWAPAWLAGPAFYGMPLSNWVGWFLTGLVIARIVLAIVPPARWRAALGAGAFPAVLYAANGIMPVATTARHGLWLAAVAGTLAMATPLVLARIASGPAPEQSETS